MLRTSVQAVRAASTAAAKPSGANIKTFEIYRYNPDQPGAKPALQVSPQIYLKVVMLF